MSDMVERVARAICLGGQSSDIICTFPTYGCRRRSQQAHDAIATMREPTDANPETDKIEVTPEMIDAGVKEFATIDPDDARTPVSEWVTDIYLAMESSRRKLGTQ